MERKEEYREGSSLISPSVAQVRKPRLPGRVAWRGPLDERSSQAERELFLGGVYSPCIWKRYILGWCHKLEVYTCQHHPRISSVSGD